MTLPFKTPARTESMPGWRKRCCRHGAHVSRAPSVRLRAAHSAAAAPQLSTGCTSRSCKQWSGSSYVARSLDSHQHHTNKCCRKIDATSCIAPAACMQGTETACTTTAGSWRCGSAHTHKEAAGLQPLRRQHPVQAHASGHTGCHGLPEPLGMHQGTDTGRTQRRRERANKRPRRDHHNRLHMCVTHHSAPHSSACISSGPRRLLSTARLLLGPGLQGLASAGAASSGRAAVAGTATPAATWLATATR